MNNNITQFESPLKTKLIYVFRINDDAHKDCLKIGETTIKEQYIVALEANNKILNESAKARINQYTQTAGTSYNLLHTEVAFFNDNGNLKSFSDSDIHNILLRSGIKKKVFDIEKKANEWFITDLETIKNAIKALKEGRNSLNQQEKTDNQNPIIFRPEQLEAIEKTKKQFTKSNQMLWNAKMRFGKTITALQVVKDIDFTRTLILTHRPVVDISWFNDFNKIFYDKPNFCYGSKKNGDLIATLERKRTATQKENFQENFKYIYFASMQDLRGSKQAGGKFDKNNEIFNIEWDFIIVDEAHEGTETELGQSVISELANTSPKILHLSGTPFNILGNYQQEEIYTWDYVMEQKAKKQWDEIYFGDHNPYSSLPQLNIFTYHLGELFAQFANDDEAFNFGEFFRVTKESGDFYHKEAVESLLNLMCQESETSNYPFSKAIYRDNFRHSLWMLPGVKEAKALSQILQAHPVFSQFTIVNVAGKGDEEEKTADALTKVENAITNRPQETYTITLSCGRLTTGVSVPAWTAVLMLAGSVNTSASSYMQTIFRVQTPATINGKVKEQCFVFDFAPDRTLKIVEDSIKISSKAKKTTEEARKKLGEFLNFCPVIAFNGSKMITYDVEKMLEQIKKNYVEKVVKTGFEDIKLYNQDELIKLDSLELEKFKNLQKIVGQTKSIAKTSDININQQGLSDEEYLHYQELNRNKKNHELSEEEQQKLAELEERKKNRQNAIAILRGISIRMPLIIYGANINNEESKLDINNFASLIDDQSWQEFMPKGVTKKLFQDFLKYYDPDIFRSASKRIRELAKEADNYSTEDRIAKITEIFANFRNPDKETVLTPWRVVNMHLGDCLGGYVFFDEEMKETLKEPRLVSHNTITNDVFAEDAKILEINSKSGLYPLYVTYSIYRKILDKKFANKTANIAEQQEIWDEVLKNNIFIICKTEMAKSITNRTLAGFRPAKINIRYFEDLVNQITEKQQNFIAKVKQGKTFSSTNNNDNMKFNAIVGNPPYQEMDGGAGSSSKPVYNKFVEIAKSISPDFVSMIIPSRWMTGGKGLDSFRDNMLNDKHLRVIHDYLDSKQCFSNVQIEGGVCYFLYNKKEQGKCLFAVHSKNYEVETSERFLNENNSDVIIKDNIAVNIIKKLKTKNDKYFSEIVLPRNPFGIDESFNQYISNNDTEHSYKIFGRFENSRGLRYLNKNIKIVKNKDIACHWKVFISKADGAAGQIGNPIPAKIIGIAELGDSNTICTETFLAIGPFKDKKTASNVINYAKSKFFRFVVGIRKTKNMTRDTYKFVPLQDFTEKSDINWSKTVAEIDQQLYAKYGLSEEEIAFIEKMIKPM